MDDLFEDFDDVPWDDCEHEPDFEKDPAESDNDFWDVPGERDWAIIFPLAEEIAREKQVQELIRKTFDKKDDEI